jgi:hypothetical protein
MNKDGDYDFDEFEEQEEAPRERERVGKPKGKKGSKKKEPQIIVEEEIEPQPRINEEEFNRQREKILGTGDRDGKAGARVQHMNVELIGENIYRLSTLYYASSREYYENMERVIDFYDGNYHIKEFEKTCALPQTKFKQLKDYCEQNERERMKRMNKEKRKDQAEEEGQLRRGEDVDRRRDLNQGSCYPEFREALEESNPLNGFEFYEDLFKDFCNQQEQSVASSKEDGGLLSPRKKKEEPREGCAAGEERRSSARKGSWGATMNTPNNNHESTRSPFMMSPRSNLYDSYYTFNNDSYYRRNPASERDDREDTANVSLFTKKAEVQKGKSQLLLREQEINREFNNLLLQREKEGKLRFLTQSYLSKRSVASGASIFKYESVVPGDEPQNQNGFGRRTERQVVLDYDHPKSVPLKLLKKSPNDYTYLNLDLVYSTWYDAALVKASEEEDSTLRKLLLIDLNDKSVFYSKLVNMLHEEEEAKEDKTAARDLVSKPVFNNDKTIEKFINKTKKDIRIKIARSKGGNEVEDRSKDDQMNEEDLKLINMLNHPNGSQGGAGGAGKPNTSSKLTNKKIRIVTNYTHSEVALNFQFNVFRMSIDKIKNLHKFDMARTIQMEIIQNRNSKWKVRLLNNSKNNYPLKQLLNQKKKKAGDINSQEIHHSHMIFKKFSKLSVKTDDYFLFEYTEKNPLIMSNIGMASRLTKYYYPNRIVKKLVENTQFDIEDKEDKIKIFRQFLKEKLGEHGEEYPLDEPDQLPLLGQLSSSKLEGLAILENNLYRAPVVKQKSKKNDFVLIRVVEKGEAKYYLRKINTIFVVGQMQPKSEVFCPYSRHFRLFLKKLLKFYINKCFREKSTVHLNELKENFPSMNDHNLRKCIKMLGGEQDQMDQKLYIFKQEILNENKASDYADEIDVSITPEELCLYEKMYQTYYELRDLGLYKMKSTDKIGIVKTKFYRQNLDDPAKCVIAKRIIQELLITSWNLSQSFLSALQTGGRMYLNGYGDPTNENGGLNFIKLPLKISRYESQLFKKNKKGKAPNQVTGSSADLRRLPMNIVHQTLKKHGYTEDTLAGLERWDKIELVRTIANDQIGQNKDEDLEKFRRDNRMTTKMQKEKYQNDINQKLITMIQNLSIANSDEIKSDDEMNLAENFDELVDAEEEELERYRNLDCGDEDQEVEVEDEESEESGHSVRFDEQFRNRIQVEAPIEF